VSDAGAAELQVEAKIIEQVGQGDCGLKGVARCSDADEDYRLPLLFAPAAAGKCQSYSLGSNIFGGETAVGRSPRVLRGLVRATLRAVCLLIFLFWKDAQL